MNKSHGLSYDETFFLSYQIVPKVNNAYSYSKEGDLEDSMKRDLVEKCIEECLDKILAPNLK